MSNPRPTKKYVIWYNTGHAGWHFLEADNTNLVEQYAQAAMCGAGAPPVVTQLVQFMTLDLLS
jgi:hypothetical protein